MARSKKKADPKNTPEETNRNELEPVPEPADEAEATAGTEASADGLVANYALGSLAVGAIPFPVVDLVALSGLQLKMLHSLAKLYGVDFSEQLGKSLIASLIGGGVPLSVATHLAALGRSLVKTLPGVGTAAGMVGMSVFGGASTYAVGKVFIQHFESGGTLLDFDPKRVKDYYAQQFEKGKETLKKAAPKKP